MEKLYKIAVLAMLASWLFMGAVFYLCVNDSLKLYPKTVTEESLQSFTSRAEYSLRYQTLLYLWLVFNVQHVIYVRLTKKAINPLVDNTEKFALEAKNILTNSFEQTLISSFVQLIFCSFAGPSTVMKFIPVVNMVQFLGRITFFLGYPNYRSFGVSLTMWPSMLMLIFNAYHFGSFLGLY